MSGQNPKIFNDIGRPWHQVVQASYILMPEITTRHIAGQLAMKANLARGYVGGHEKVGYVTGCVRVRTLFYFNVCRPCKPLFELLTMFNRNPRQQDRNKTQIFLNILKEVGNG